jgi:hypothetical protein
VLAVTLLIPVLFLMAVVVFYGCLLAVLTHRLGLQAIGRRKAGSAFLEASLSPAGAARPLVSRDSSVVRFLIVVSRQSPDRYAELRRIFGAHGNTDVIFDRRRPDPDSPRLPGGRATRHPERRQRYVDEDLRATGWAMLRLTGELETP